MMKKDKTIFYTLTLLAMFAMLAGVILVPTLVVYHSGESWPHQKQVDAQIAQDAILSYGLMNDEVGYKKTLYNTIKPEITVIGSSRVLQYRSDMFTKSFVNMGRGLVLHNIRSEIEFLGSNPNLKLVLWGVDYWNFGHRFCEDPARYAAQEQSVGVNSANIAKFSNFIPREVLNVWPMFFDGRVSPEKFLAYVTAQRERARNKIGLRALYSDKGGYLKDGFYVYLDQFLDEAALAQNREKEIDETLQSGAPYQITDAERYCDQQISDIRYVQEYLSKKGVQLVIFLPPLPARHTNLLLDNAQGKIIYGNMLRDLKSLDPETKVYNYLDTDTYALSDSEFIDQIHPGEVVSARILKDLEIKHPGFPQYLDHNFLNQTLSACIGHAHCMKDLGQYLTQL